MPETSSINFRHFPSMGWNYGFWFALGIMCESVGGLWWYVRKGRLVRSDAQPIEDGSALPGSPPKCGTAASSTLGRAGQSGLRWTLG